MAIRRSLPVLAMSVALLMVGCSSESSSEADSPRASDPSDTSDSSDTGTATTAPRTATPSSLTEPASGGDLAGSWTADIADILAANTINLGASTPIPCSGPMVMTFGDDGSFGQAGTMTCAFGEMSVNGELSGTGRWQTSGSTLIISGTVSTATLVMGGVEVPMTDLVPVPDTISDGTGEYSVVGDTLTITFTADAVGTVVQIYTRAT